jgi:hypothetical protein
MIMNKEFKPAEQPEIPLTPHHLAQEHAVLLKDSVAQKFGITPENIDLLLDNADGVYLSKEDPNTLCCLATDQKNGFLYLITGKIDSTGKILSDFICDIVG